MRRLIWWLVDRENLQFQSAFSQFKFKDDCSFGTVAKVRE